MADSDKFMVATITKRVDHAEDLFTVWVRPEQALAFKPGQYVAFGVEDRDHKVLERAFSIVSSPAEEQLEFYIERVPGGALSPRLYELGVGDAVQMRKKAKGVFALDTISGHRKHFFVCTVTGVAPYVSILRTLLRDEAQGRPFGGMVVLMQGAARSDEFAYAREIEAVTTQAPWLTYIPTISRPWDDPGWTGERGRVDDLVRKYADQLGLIPDETTGYLCGNPGMIVNARGILKRRGYGDKAIKEETYWAPGEGEVEY
jgi:ferredoxin/flavodoxin---NADP+ reductase